MNKRDGRSEETAVAVVCPLTVRQLVRQNGFLDGQESKEPLSVILIGLESELEHVHTVALKANGDSDRRDDVADFRRHRVAIRGTP